MFKMSARIDPLTDLLVEKQVVVLDGALATRLESLGLDLSSALWSAKALQETPELIRHVHLEYFRSGADVAITSSYQATALGLETHLGMDVEQSKTLIRKSVELAQQARDTVLEEERQLNSSSKPRKLLIAGSVGPYGAYLADGSEYRGDYQLSKHEMKAFHRARIQALLEAGVEILACETIPSFAEVKALVELLETEFPTAAAWFAFTTRDSGHLSDGTPLTDVIDVTNSCDQIVAVGVNCIPEASVSAVLDHMGPFTNRPLIVYPNSGEQWDAQARAWTGKRAQGQEHEHVIKEWYDKGAKLIGGCCRTGPKDIEVIKGCI